MMPNAARQRKRGKDAVISNKGLQRSLIYLRKCGSSAVLPYTFLIISTISQLMVPRMVRNIIDAVTSGYIADQVLTNLEKIPAQFQSLAIPKILEFLSLPSTMDKAQMVTKLTADKADAPSKLIWAAAAIVLFACLRGLFSFLQAFWGEKNSQTVAYELRNDIFAKIQRLSFSYHDRNQTGQLMVRATDDVEKVRLFLGQGLVQLVGALILIIGTLIILFSTNAKLAMATLPILPAALLLFMLFGTISQPLFAKVQARLSELNTTLQENLAGIKVIQAFTREASEQRKFNTQADAVMRQQISVSRVFAFLFPLIFMVANLGQAATLYFGGQQIINGSLSLGEYQEFSLYLIYLFLPLAQFGIIITQLGQAGASAQRIFEILDAENNIQDSPNAQTLPTIQGRVQFENVSFRYFESGDPVLQEINLIAEPGQTIALLGATGSGKTTIINLLPRFYDVSQGSITIDGLDVRQLKLDSLRSQIGIVLQETTLFSGTIRDNIAFGKTDATDEQVQAAARAAAAHDFILTFPQGYDTPVGERGTTLSGGQKQRLAIARALLLDPRILILDDSTSSVDVQTEAVIQKALDTLMKGRTSFVIAQRISTVLNADQILVLEKGKIVARGKHADLLENSAAYAEIYNSQLVEDAPKLAAVPA
jgi:ATP-binding cassette subfamily B multidrug efflux pump